jgi:hypothetical protein
MTAPARCPFCESDDTEQVSAWGSQIITSQSRCRSCNSYFEVVREEFARSWTTSSEGARSEQQPPDRYC